MRGDCVYDIVSHDGEALRGLDCVRSCCSMEPESLKVEADAMESR